MFRLCQTLVVLSAVAQCWARASLIQEPLQPEKKHLSLTHDLIGFHKNLTQIESITGNEEGVGEWLVSSLQSQGYHVEKQYVTKKPARFNVLAWPGKEREAKVLLSSHIDTVSVPYHEHCHWHIGLRVMPGPAILPVRARQR